jgi:hypothetical protein
VPHSSAFFAEGWGGKAALLIGNGPNVQSPVSRTDETTIPGCPASDARLRVHRGRGLVALTWHGEARKPWRSQTGDSGVTYGACVVRSSPLTTRVSRKE